MDQSAPNVIQCDAGLIAMRAMMGQSGAELRSLGITELGCGRIMQDAVEQAIGQLQTFRSPSMVAALVMRSAGTHPLPYPSPVSGPVSA